MTVAELLERMSSREFSEWMAYYEVEPFGEERADLRQAMTTTAVVNSVQAQAKRPKWAKPEDFMFFSGNRAEKAKAKPGPEKVEPKSPEELKGKMMAFMGGRKS